MTNKLQLFEESTIRSVWDSQTEEWYFSVADVCNVLSGSQAKDPNAYWRKLKQRLKAEGSEIVTNCHGLKLESSLAEVTTTSISRSRKPNTFEESRQIAREGGSVARDTRRNIESRIGQSVISPTNAHDKLALDVSIPAIEPADPKEDDEDNNK